ncbi:hypothetical protein TNCV_1853711 [Trichonephila clavipes]|nr:hypothetical protein TNCV_1853711 [Trichonephila clavipes]
MELFLLQKGSGVSLLVESYLGGVYAPFSSVRRQLTEQALARCREVGREHFEAHILSPTASMLRAVKEHWTMMTNFRGYGIVVGVSFRALVLLKTRRVEEAVAG